MEKAARLGGYAGLVLLILFAALGATNNVRWTQISVSDRHGAGAYGQSSDGTGASGHVAAFNASGALTDGGTSGGSSPLTTKGDLHGFSTADARIPVGVDGTVLTADSTAALGVSYQATSSTLGDIFSSGKPAGTAMSTSTFKGLSVASGATADLLPTVTAAGYVTELCVFTNQYASEIIVTVDGEVTPSIDGNVADLLGSNYLDTASAFAGLWIVGTNNGPGQLGGTFKLPIPFASSVHVQVKNNSGSTAVLTGYVIVHTGVADTWPYTQRLKMAVVSAGSITALTETNMVNVSPGKKGRLAGFGFIYDAFPGSVSPIGAGLEGAFKIYLDGSATSSYTTSGSEDIFGEGWYFNHFNAFSNTQTLAPASGDEVLTVFNNSTGEWGAQRFFIHDPIVFNTGLRMTWTCGSPLLSFTGTCTMKTTVYYYQEN